MNGSDHLTARNTSDLRRNGLLHHCDMNLLQHSPIYEGGHAFTYILLVSTEAFPPFLHRHQSR